MFRTLVSIILLLYVTTGGSLYGQGWELRFPSEILAGAADMAFTESGDLIVVGSNVSAGAGRAVRLGPDGQLRWSTQLSNLPLQEMVTLPDGRYGVFGWRVVNSSAWIPYVVFDATGRKLHEYVNKVDSLYQMQLVKVFPTADGDFLLTGYTLAEDESGAYDFFLARANNEGQIRWIRRTDISTKDWCFDAQETADGNFLLSGLTRVDDNDRPTLLKIDREGQEIWRSVESGMGFGFYTLTQVDAQRGITLSYSDPPNTADRLWVVHFDLQTGATLQKYRLDGVGILPRSALLDQDGTLIFSGNQRTSTAPISNRLALARISLQGDLFWSRSYGQSTSNQNALLLQADPDGGYLVGGQQPPGTVNSNAYLVKTDRLGYSRTNVIRGRVVQAACTLPPEGPPLSNWLVQVRSDQDTLYALSDANGDYAVRVDTGDFTVELFPPNIYWSACTPLQNSSLVGSFDTVQVDFPVEANYQCPLLRVDVSTPLLRRCYENTYYVNYCNEGTVTAPNALLEVALDSFFQVEGSAPAWTDRAGQVLYFELGAVAPGACGQVQISGRLDCEQTQLGQSHCTQVQAFPDSLCTPPGINWDGSSIEVIGRCVGDSVKFYIRNVGEGAMIEASQYIVIEDLIIHRSGNFQLGPGEELPISIAATGATYRLEARQAPGHPVGGRSSSTVEGCRLDDLPFSTGFINQFPLDESDPFIAIDCTENIGSWDPNDIQVYPQGVGPEKLIDRETELEYHIRFQNTGTDTAFRVQVLDTLPIDLLDLESLKMGATSHNFTWEITPKGILNFFFDPIILPDSTTNEAASHGFVRFKIRPVANILPGAVIPNRAAIYFDFNEAVITNTAQVKIRKPVSYRSFEEQRCSPLVETPEKITIVDTLVFPELDSIHILNLTLFPQHQVIIDTILTEGGTLGGTSWYEDGVFANSLLNRWGCDSLISIHITIDTTLTATDSRQLREESIRIYPNPVSDHFYLEYFIPTPMPLVWQLTDARGQSLSRKFALASSGRRGHHRIRWAVPADLPPGVYWLRLEFGGQPYVKRLVIF